MPTEYNEYPGRTVKHFPGRDLPNRETPPREIFPDSDPDVIRQTSCYKEGNRAEPDNNMFFEERSNPLSSKGS